MLSSLLRPRRRRRFQRGQKNQTATSYRVAQSGYDGSRPQARHAIADWTETEDNEEDTEGDIQYGEEARSEDDDEEAIEEEDGEDEDEAAAPLLPIFSTEYLDGLPVYNLTHAIRVIILPRVETTLTWDQLRSPQVSQFLVKPMQQQIRSMYFSRATLYALMANCLQFRKEGQGPGNSGTSRTRAMVCELLAMKMLKEYNTRELIDGLSYDWSPLQGAGQATNSARNRSEELARPRPASARISTLEVAIRAQSKRFLAHPLVVQQLEAIWAGTIVFHSAADQLHRQIPEPDSQNIRYGTTDDTQRPASFNKMRQPPPPAVGSALIVAPIRRSVTIYDPRDASLFKLSRLRVPRYRQFFSTCSLAILLGLFLAVLIQRSVDITMLEIVFWLWSAGFMLDEIVGFNEQGLSLYIMSFWNIFDLGILLLLIIFYSMRLYSMFLLSSGKKHWNSMAYDVLATNAVLLFPRLFSILDHYQYFSQLLIAFRLMAVDLAAVFVLILISCSGFFVAFTLSFGKNEYDAGGVAYGLFQILMGFTPAAWQAWESYNVLGRIILMLFLFISHFLIVTILITVLTNSFLAIVANANDEHQFLFAVNTISMVKNDALFSYVAPSNLLAWFFSPLRYVMPFREFVRFNRFVIKLTHFPLLFGIFAYEKLFLARTIYEPTDLIDHRHRGRPRIVSFLHPKSKEGLFSPNKHVRQESVAGFQKDRALEEVFRMTPQRERIPSIGIPLGRQSSNEVRNWMEQHEGIAGSPPEQNYSVIDRPESKRRNSRRASMPRFGQLRPELSGAKSASSDPADLIPVAAGPYQKDLRAKSYNDIPTIAVDKVGQTEDDGDDELVTNDDEENLTLDRRSRSNFPDSGDGSDYFHPRKLSSHTAPFPAFPAAVLSSSAASSHLNPRYSPQTPKGRSTRRMHARNASTNTMIFNPLPNPAKQAGSSSPPNMRPGSSKHTPSGTGHQTPTKRPSSAKPRPIPSPRAEFQPTPAQPDFSRRRSSSLDLLDSIGEVNIPGTLSASFATQMAQATSTDRAMGRLLLARMKTLEEGLRDVAKEVRGVRTRENSELDQDAGDERRKGKRVVRRGGKNMSVRRDGRGVEDDSKEAVAKGNSL